MSKPGNTTETKIDLSIFKDNEDEHTEECDQYSNDPIEGCTAVKRLICALKYYALLDIVKSKNHQDKFRSFCEVYVQCLDDYTHLVTEHDNLQEISEVLKENTLLNGCDVAKCSFASRHHSNDINTPIDSVLKFYSKTLDSLHFYVLHLFECGLRTETTDDTDDTKDYDIDGKFFDKQFERISRIINDRKHLSLSFTRLKNNSKFNISIKKQKETDDSSTTFMDGLCSFLLSNNIKQTVITKFQNFVVSQQYDSDSLKTDFKQETGGNIGRDIDDKALVAVVDQFIKATELRASSFNIGLIFYYWPKYQNMEEFDQNTAASNLNDHTGYTISDLFVKQRHPGFKDEIMNYRFLNMTQYENLMIKVKEYMETKSVKQIKAMNNPSGYIQLDYGIKDDDAILSDHLLSVFLYTDYTELCTHFSATFRAIKQYESLSSIKARNSKYWWMAKSLREIVQLYGTKGKDYDEWDTLGKHLNLLGPFYCGLSVTMPFPEFEIRLCGPTSTSKQIEIATRFAGHGMVVELNNTVFEHEHLSGFECAWLSHFKEEDEVIFMGGHHRIKIESVRILNGKDGKCQNFELFFSALCKFNNIFNGAHIDKCEMSKTEIEIISKLFECTLGLCDLKDEIDQYVLDTFDAFRINKQQIVFDYCWLCSRYNKDLIDMVFYEMKNGDDFRPSKDEKTNVFRNVLFKLFPNIQHIVIYTTGDCGGDPYALSFSGLLSEIEKETFNQITVKAVHEYASVFSKKQEKESWIHFLWSSSSNVLTQKYKQKGYQMLFENAINWNNKVQDCVVIKKI